MAYKTVLHIIHSPRLINGRWLICEDPYRKAAKNLLPVVEMSLPNRSDKYQHHHSMRLVRY